MNWTLDLNEHWDIYIDENNPEMKNIKYCDISDSSLWKSINVPGCWDILIDSKVFQGPVWYRKEVLIPDLNSKENRMILKFDAVSYYSEIFINENFAGSHEGMWDRFSIDITDKVKYGEVNTIALRIYKQGYEPTDEFPLRQTLAGFIPDVICTFGGIWGKVTLEEKPVIYMENAYVEADIHNSTAKVHVHVHNPCQIQKEIKIKSIITDGENIAAETLKRFLVKESLLNEFIIDVYIDNPILWDTDNPHLYNARIELLVDEDRSDTKTKRFGMREIKSEGRNILLNGKPVYIRGLLHWGYYPDTIHPNVGRETIRRELEKIKEFGFNAVKHCLYIPWEDYFELADEMGILLWLELPLWIPEVTEKLKPRMEFEYPRIITQAAGHPSLIMYSLGCELNSDIDSSILKEMYHLAKQCSGNLLVRDNSGSGECYGGLTVDYADFYDYHFYGDIHNMENLIETFTPEWREVRPWVFGEFCDIDTYRDIRKVKEAFKDEKLWWTLKDKQKNPVSYLKDDFLCELMEDRMRRSGLSEESELLEELGLNHAVLHRKYTLEMTRRYPAICGYNITAIRDVPIATSGIFDDLMNSKFNAENFRKFNDDIVLSPAWNLNRTWINGDRVLNKDRYNFKCGDFVGLHVVASNYSRDSLKDVRITWKAVKDGGSIAAEDCFKLNKEIKVGSVEEVVYVTFNAPKVEVPTGISIEVQLEHERGSVLNDWRIWVYPEKLRDTSEEEVLLYDTHGILEDLKKLYALREIDERVEIKKGIVITTHMSLSIENYLKAGGRVFYIQRGKGYLPQVKTSFWRESFCRYYEHEIIKNTAKDEWRDLQLFGVASDSAIDTLSINHKDIKNIKPIIRRVDARQYLATDYLLEMNVGKGLLIATTLKFEGGTGKQPNSLKYNNFGIYLLDQVIRYLLGTQE
jgi:hypothetical protein